MFWQRYSYLCQTMGEKPTVLARQLGAKSASVVANWQNGSVPREPLLSKIAEHFGVTKGFLLGIDEDPFVKGMADDAFTMAMHGYSGELSEEDKETIIRMAKALAGMHNREN